MQIEIRHSKAKQGGGWKWRTRSKGRIGVWSEGYYNRADCEASIDAHKRMLPGAPIVEVK